MDRAPHNPPAREALSPGLLSAFARSSDQRFSEDHGRPPLSGRRSTDAEAGRPSLDSAAGPSVEPPTRMSVDRLNRSGILSAGLRQKGCFNLWCPRVMRTCGLARSRCEALIFCESAWTMSVPVCVG